MKFALRSSEIFPHIVISRTAHPLPINTLINTESKKKQQQFERNLSLALSEIAAAIGCAQATINAEG